MNPYAKTAEEMKRQSEGPKRFAQTATKIGIGAAATAFSPLLSRAAPFLSQYIPEDLAIKGLSKISPSFGKFIQSARDKGYDFQEVKDFIGEQINQSQSAKESRNIIEQYSPELHQFILGEIQKGRKPIEAAALAQNDKRFGDVIKKLVKDHKAPWSQILQGIYGNGDMAQPSQPAQNPQSQAVLQKKPENSLGMKVGDRFIDKNGNEAILTQLNDKTFEYKTQKGIRSGPLNSLQNEIGSQPEQPQQPGQGQQALMQILQKINQKFGGQ